VTARNDPQGPIGFVAIIEMQTNGQHLLQEFYRWLDMRDSIFRAPGSKTGYVDASEKSEGQILMPAHALAVARLLHDERGVPEQDVGPDERLDRVQDGRMTHQLGHERQDQMRLRRIVQPPAPMFAVLHAPAQLAGIGRGHDADREQHAVPFVARDCSVRQAAGHGTPLSFGLILSSDESGRKAVADESTRISSATTLPFEPGMILK